MKEKVALAGELITEIRRSFQLLRQLSDTMNADVGVTAAMRSVMETLADHGSRTVPDIAAEKHVSRQHIQKNADELMRTGLAKSRPNPAHKRSVLIELTPAGRVLFETIRQSETELIERIVAPLPDQALIQSNNTLKAFRERMAKET